MRRIFLATAGAIAALAIAEFALIWSSSRTSDVSNYVPPTIIVAGTVEDTGSVPGISIADGESAYIEVKVAAIQADSVAEMQAAEDGSSLPEKGDTLMFIRSGYTERTYGPESEIGDEVEAEAWFCKEDIVLGGEHRTAYSLWHIETYDWLIETGQRSSYPEIPRPVSEMK
ncbi:MAG: hypothetical protein ACI4P4_00630 [Faecousia sp.]